MLQSSYIDDSLKLTNAELGEENPLFSRKYDRKNDSIQASSTTEVEGPSIENGNQEYLTTSLETNYGRGNHRFIYLI